MKDFGLMAMCLGIIAATFGSWITHIIVAIQAKAWGLLIAGAILPPIGMVHGWATWLGFSWI